MTVKPCPLGTSCTTTGNKHKEDTNIYAEHKHIADLSTYSSDKHSAVHSAYEKYAHAYAAVETARMNNDKELTGLSARKQYEDLYALKVEHDKAYVAVIKALQDEYDLNDYHPMKMHVPVHLTGDILADIQAGKKVSSNKIRAGAVDQQPRGVIHVVYPRDLSARYSLKYCADNNIFHQTYNGVVVSDGTWLDVHAVSSDGVFIVQVPEELRYTETSLEHAVLEAAYTLLLSGYEKATVHLLDVDGVTEKVITEKDARELLSEESMETAAETLEALRCAERRSFSSKNVSPVTSNKSKTFANQLAAWSGASVDKAAEAVQDLMTLEDDETRHNVLRYVWSHFTVQGRNIVAIDFEATNGFRPLKGTQIIESGLSIQHADGSTDTVQAYHGIDQADLDINGTGYELLHKVSPRDIIGQGRWLDSESLAVTQDLLNRGYILLAHNAAFEESFLQAAGVEYSPEQVLDTKHVAEFIDMRREQDAVHIGSTLEDFTSRYGVPYKNAHSAFADADMTLKTLLVFDETLSRSKDTLGGLLSEEAHSVASLMLEKLRD